MTIQNTEKGMANSGDKQKRDIPGLRKYQIKNARGQAAYKARRREAGYQQIAIWIHQDTREAGRLAGLEYDMHLPDAAQNDPLGWMVGFAEGLRLREKKCG